MFPAEWLFFGRCWTSQITDHVKPSWSAEKSDFFFRGNSELSVRRLPAETSADTVTNIGVPHMDELCDHVMLLHIVMLLLLFSLFKYNSGEAAPGGQDCRKQAHPAAAAAVAVAAGVCSIPMTVQIRGGECNHTAAVRSFTTRRGKKKDLAFSKLRLLLPLQVFKPANHSRAFPQTLFSGYILTFITIVCAENLV